MSPDGNVSLYRTGDRFKYFPRLKDIVVVFITNCKTMSNNVLQIILFSIKNVHYY